MSNQEAKIRQLLESVILTKEEMEAGLKKEGFTKQWTHKLSKYGGLFCNVVNS